MRRAVAIALACTAACAAAPPRRPAPLAPAEPAAVLAAVRAREERVRSLRARFTATTRFDGAERVADGVLLVVKPDRFRLRLFLPLGITVFDYVNAGEQVWVTLPLAPERGAAGDAAGNGGFAAFSRAELGQAFLRGVHAFPGRCDAARAPSGGTEVTCVDDGAAAQRVIRIDADGLIREELSEEAGATRLVLRYDDYREVDGAVLPLRITLGAPLRGQSVDIVIDRYEVNPALPDELFAPPGGA